MNRVLAVCFTDEFSEPVSLCIDRPAMLVRLESADFLATLSKDGTITGRCGGFMYERSVVHLGSPSL